MTPERFQHVATVFDEALACAEADREVFLAAACGDDADLRAHVEELLERAGGARAALEDAIGAEAEELAAEQLRELVGRRLGPYRLRRLIGEGGMGAVYLAERDDAAYAQRVAVKILKHGFVGAEAMARFRDERQILAALDHPNIVGLLDGGADPAGVPYLVMAYLEGEPITAFARRHALSVRERVVLLLIVCGAVQYAHARLVIHRDLKPANILVDDAGVPHLLDFGIAKLLAPSGDAGAEARTRTGTHLLTPEYASPEQARGEHATTAMDVYSLGAVLYELLAGRAPVEKSADPLEMLRRVCEVEPPRPSAVATEHRAELAGDLDNIVGKALCKDPAGRYASVEQLAGDLRRYLTGLPIAARPATPWYRARKFVRRNRGKVAVAAVLGLALLGMSAVLLVEARRADEQARRADRRFDDVRGLAASLVFELDDRIRDLKGATSARELVVTRALEYLDRLAAEASDDAGLTRELALAYMKVGDIQGNQLMPNLGRPRDGLASYAKAHAVLARLPAPDRTIRTAELLGTGVLQFSAGEDAAAEETLTRAFALAAGQPPSERLMQGYVVMTDRMLHAGRMTEVVGYASRCYDAAVAWRRADDTPTARYWVASALELRAMATAQLGDPAGAARDLTEALGLTEALAAQFPANGSYQREQANCAYLLAAYLGGVGGDPWEWVSSTGDTERAEDASRTATTLFERIAERDPDDLRAAADAAAQLSVEAALVARRDPALALPMFERSLAMWSRLPPAVRDAHYNQQLEWHAHCAIAPALAAAGRGTEARAEAARGMAILGRAAAGTVEDELLQCRFLDARTEALLGDAGAARALLDTEVASLDARIAAHPLEISNYLGRSLALELYAEVAPADACAWRARALAGWRAWPGSRTPYFRDRESALAARACPGGAP